MKRSLGILAVLGLFSVVVPLAAAQAIAQSDPNDSRGVLDIGEVERTAQSDGSGDPSGYRYRIEMRDQWICEQLAPRDGRSLRWRFDDRGSNKADFVGKFVCKEGGLIFQLKSVKGDNYEPLPANKTDKEVTVVIPGGFFRNEGSMRTWATSKERSGRCHPCTDRAPDSGSL